MAQRPYFNPLTGKVSYTDDSGQIPTFSAGSGGSSGWNPTVIGGSANQTSYSPDVGDPAGYAGMRGQVTQGANFSPNMTRLQSLVDDPSSIQNDPSYKFSLNEGNRTINRSAAAKGTLGSGNVLAELAKYGQGMASQEYGNQFNRLSDLVRQQQSFGLQSGYFQEPARTTTGWEGAGLVTRRNENPSFW